MSPIQVVFYHKALNIDLDVEVGYYFSDGIIIESVKDSDGKDWRDALSNEELDLLEGEIMEIERDWA